MAEVTFQKGEADDSEAFVPYPKVEEAKKRPSANEINRYRPCRLAIMVLFVLSLVALLTAAIILIIRSPKCSDINKDYWSSASVISVDALRFASKKDLVDSLKVFKGNRVVAVRHLFADSGKLTVRTTLGDDVLAAVVKEARVHGLDIILELPSIYKTHASNKVDPSLLIKDGGNVFVKNEFNYYDLNGTFGQNVKDQIQKLIKEEVVGFIFQELPQLLLLGDLKNELPRLHPIFDEIQKIVREDRTIHRGILVLNDNSSSTVDQRVVSVYNDLIYPGSPSAIAAVLSSYVLHRTAKDSAVSGTVAGFVDKAPAQSHPLLLASMLTLPGSIMVNLEDIVGLKYTDAATYGKLEESELLPFYRTLLQYRTQSSLLKGKYYNINSNTTSVTVYRTGPNPKRLTDNVVVVGALNGPATVDVQALYNLPVSASVKSVVAAYKHNVTTAIQLSAVTLEAGHVLMFELA